MLNLCYRNSISVGSSNQQSKRHFATIYNGVKMAESIKEEVKYSIGKMREKHEYFHPKLIAVSVGDNLASNIYLKRKSEAAQYCGINFDKLCLPDNTSEEHLVTLLQDLNSDSSVHGIIVQLPLPSHIRETYICNSVSPEKDVDGFTATSLGKLMQNVDTKTFVPCTALAVMKIVQNLGIRLIHNWPNSDIISYYDL